MARHSPAECARVRRRSEGTSLLASMVCLCADTLAVCSFAVSAPLFLLFFVILFFFPFCHVKFSAARGGDVTLVCRSAGRAEEARRAIENNIPPGVVGKVPRGWPFSDCTHPPPPDSLSVSLKTRGLRVGFAIPQGTYYSAFIFFPKRARTGVGAPLRLFP